MKLSAEHVARLEAFLETIKAQTYPEPPSPEHNEITARMIERVWTIGKLAPGIRVLDVGCGQGVALRHFAERGCVATGVTLNAVDAEKCRQLGYEVMEMDQSFLDFPEGAFDLIWCRHCLEHSIFPYFTLHGFARLIRPGGWLYIEVPAPDTSCRHQNNPNHYSVLGRSMLMSLISRSGFQTVDMVELTFKVPVGPDAYWAFLQQKQ